MDDPSTDSVAAADRLFRLWMRQNLETAARHFQATIAGPAVFGWLDRTIGARCTQSGHERWLRVASEQLEWAGGLMWTGNVESSVVTGIPKPIVLDVHEWEQDHWRRQRAELMTLLPGQPCSPTDVAQLDDEPSSHWWSQLGDALTRLAATPTTRVSINQAKVDRRTRAAFGTSIRVEIQHWETVHGDLHWANLMLPFGILDWEQWGTGPAGYDAATLYCYSLTQPYLAEKVREKFSDVLDSPSGRCALLYVAARLLDRSGQGDHPNLVAPLRCLTDQILGQPLDPAVPGSE